MAAPRYTGTRRIATSAQRVARREITAQFQQVADEVSLAILQAAGGDPNAPVPYDARNTRAETAVRQAAAAAIHRMFIGSGVMDPFADDGVTALSPYAQTINKAIATVTGQVVMGHTRWMADTLPADILVLLTQTPSRPVPVAERRGQYRPEDNPYLQRAGESAEDHLARLNDIRIFSTDPPRAEYEPAHTWVDPNGYRLSDRIWNTSQEARQRLDEVLRTGIREGQTALELSRNVEQFLKPSQLHRRTRWPYDVDVSYPSMRLAITEIARSTNAAAEIAAYNNPYINFYDIRRSGQGGSCAVCDRYATIGSNGERLREPYRVGDGVNAPFHPNCMCRWENILDPDAPDVDNQIRAGFEAGYEPVTTPAQPDNFAQRLLGPSLYTTMRQILGDTWKSISQWLRIP